MAEEAMDVCSRVLKESNKSRFNSYSVRNSVLSISHITFQDCRGTFFPTIFLEIAEKVQERLSTALWFISGAEMSIRLDKDLKCVDDDSLIWDFRDFLHELRCNFWNLGFPQFMITPQDWLLFSRKDP